MKKHPSTIYINWQLLGIYIQELHKLQKTKYKINRGEKERIRKIGKETLIMRIFLCTGMRPHAAVQYLQLE